MTELLCFTRSLNNQAWAGDMSGHAHEPFSEGVLMFQVEQVCTVVGPFKRDIMSFNLWGFLFFVCQPYIEHANTRSDSITYFCFQPPPTSVYDVAYPNTSEKVDVQEVETAVCSPSEPSEEFKVNVTNFGLVHTYHAYVRT